MRISTEIGSISPLVGTEKAIRLIAEAGFDAWDFTTFDLYKPQELLGGTDCITYARHLKQIGLECGIVCNQSHAPYPSSLDVIPLLQQAIRCTAEAGGKLCVVHPIAFEPLEKSVELYRALLPTAKECDVKICAENLVGWDDEKKESFFATGATPQSIVELLDAVNDPYLVACLDVGHAEMRPAASGAPKMIHALGDRLQALHLHDNDCCYDHHQLPLTMSIDYDAVLQALNEVKYKGDFTLEAVHYMLNKFTTETVADGLRTMATTARKLANRFEQL